MSNGNPLVKGGLVSSGLTRICGKHRGEQIVKKVRAHREWSILITIILVVVVILLNRKSNINIGADVSSSTAE